MCNLICHYLQVSLLVKLLALDL
uniref:Uncharacterized protein n=1 Tax=Arundo donax TaxID=35708 RepID=A0A0A9A1C1_ARUDO